jgi:hypothetical protein
VLEGHRRQFPECVDESVELGRNPLARFSRPVEGLDRAGRGRGKSLDVRERIRVRGTR